MEGKAEGYGVMSWTVGAKYAGLWKENMRNGQGTFYDVDGVVYQGEWADNR